MSHQTWRAGDGRTITATPDTADGTYVITFELLDRLLNIAGFTHVPPAEGAPQ